MSSASGVRAFQPRPRLPQLEALAGSAQSHVLSPWLPGDSVTASTRCLLQVIQHRRDINQKRLPAVTEASELHHLQHGYLSDHALIEDAVVRGVVQAAAAISSRGFEGDKGDSCGNNVQLRSVDGAWRRAVLSVHCGEGL